MVAHINAQNEVFLEHLDPPKGLRLEQARIDRRLESATLQG
jgi:hypothetical protein